MKPTFSRADLLLECTFWASPDVRVTSGAPGPAARFGTCVHELLALEDGIGISDKKLRKRYQDVDVDLALQTAERARQALRKWLDSGNIDAVPNVRRELPLAYDVEKDKAREIHPAREEDHVYADATAYEMPGTIDLLLFSDSLGIVVDYKTGHDIYRPDSMAQLWCGALAAQRVYGFKRCILAVLHATAEGVPIVYASDTQVEANLDAFRARLAKAWRSIGDGSLRPGVHCESLYCPAYEACPSHASTLTALGAVDSLRALGSPEEVGAAYEKLRQYDQLADAVRGWIRRSIREGKHPGVTSQGVLELQLRERRNLSQASVLRALGDKAGKRMLKKLDEAGCIETSSYETLTLVKERG